MPYNNKLIKNRLNLIFKMWLIISLLIKYYVSLVSNIKQF